MSLVRAVRVILEGLQGLPEAARQEADALLKELEEEKAETPEAKTVEVSTPPAPAPAAPQSAPTELESSEPVNPQIVT